MHGPCQVCMTADPRRHMMTFMYEICCGICILLHHLFLAASFGRRLSMHSMLCPNYE